MMATLLRTAARSARGRFRKTSFEPPSLPGPVLTAGAPPRNRRLVDDFIRHVGGDPAWYADSMPPHMFPQWGLPLLARVLRDVPYDVSRVLNAGCRLEVHRRLPANEPLLLQACLEEVDDNGRRAILKQRLVTGTESAPEALICRVDAIVQMRRAEDGAGKPKPTVPEDAHEIDRWHLPKRSGLRFAVLTGDFNPIHWLALYARLAGFTSVILHGFSTLARTVETLNRVLWSGQPERLRAMEVRFVRPVVLPADVGVYVHGQRDLFVGELPGTTAFLVGHYTAHAEDYHG
jgi:acyl dehydratase